MPGLSRCLVVTGEAAFRNRLQSATELAGWQECEAPDASADLQAVADGDYQLALIDVANPLGERMSDVIAVAEELASRPETLVVICGPENGIDEELWARQLGAWVYLPGVIAGDGLVSLFREAGRLAERRSAFAMA
jgi:DNA-binding NtrC family response regulator